MWNGMDGFYRTLERCRTEGLGPTERFLLQSMRQAQSEGTNSALGIVMHELGCFYRDIGCYTQSLAALQKAADLVAAESGRACSQYAAVLNSLAGSWRLLGEFGKAIEMFQQAVALYRQLGDDDAYICVLHNLSAAYRQDRQLDPAIDCLERALVAMEKLPGRRQQACITYTDLAALYHAAGRTEASRACIGRALQEFDKNAEQAEGSYAAGLSSLAGLLYAQGDHEQALELYQRSAQYIKEAFGETLEYAAACQHLYWIYERLGRREPACEALAAAGRVYEAVLGHDHERTRAVADDLRRLQRLTPKARAKEGELL